MEVNVSELRKQYDEFQKKMNEYDNIYLNIYNEVNQANSYWKDNIATSFFSYCEERKGKIELYINELDDMSKVYQYIINKYSELGEKVKVELNNRDSVIAKIDNFIYAVDDLINFYRSIDLSFCPSEAYVLNNHIVKLNDDKRKLQGVKDEVKGIFDSIASIEHEVALKISKLKVELLTRLNSVEYV